MASERCGAQHPEDETIVCRLTDSHRDHLSNGVFWSNRAVDSGTWRPLPEKTKGKKGAMSRITKWLHPEQEDEWVVATIETVTQWLREHSEPFTTAQAWWPLLDAPPDKRVMNRVVNHFIANHSIEEVNTIRLKGTYVTRDGHEFKMNKIVPIYQSRICS